MKKGIFLLLVTMFYAMASIAQTRTITGNIKGSDDGLDVIGATVKVKNGDLVTVTDGFGNFTLDVPNDKNVLVVTTIGYLPQEVKIDTAKAFNIRLRPDNKSMNEVVVVGYGTVKRKDLTGSVSSVSARDIADNPLNSASDVLTGRLAGVNIVSSEGQPGAEATVRIRGGGSITQDNAPIYIVDGIQLENALQILSPNEIESVDVLKDAASTAIYGARGANGVILITTKGGRNAKTRVSVDMFYGSRKIVHKLDVMSPTEFVDYQYQVYNLGGDTAKSTSFTNRYGRYDDLDIYENMPGTDWQDQVFGRSAKTFTQNLNLSGGDKKTTFSFNLTNTNEEGIMINSGFKRTMASLKLDHKISDRVKVGVNARYGEQRIQGAGTSNSGTQANNRLRNAVRYQPYIGQGQDIDVFDPNYAELTNLTSPVLLANQEVSYTYRRDVLLNGFANVDLAKGLQFRTVLGIAPSFLKTNQFSGVVTSIARQNAGMPVTVLSRGEGMTLTNSNTLSYTGKSKKLNYDVLIGEETYQTTATAVSVTTKYLPVDITSTEAFSGIQRATPPAGLIQDAPTSVDQSPNKMLSFFGRANANYKDKYLATVTFRRDGSNRFNESNRWGNFPSAALAWRLSSEKFWQDVVDPKRNVDVKMRFSMGSVGNNRIAGDLYQTMFGISTSSYAFGEAITPGIAPLSNPNPNIKWETTISRNLGLDISMLNNRISLTADFYLNNTKDLLLLAQIPQTSGYTTQQQNIGKTENKGMEFQLNTVPIRNKNFSWNSNFNIAFNKNKVVSLGNNPDGTPVQSIYGYSGWITAGTADYLIEVGKPIGQIYGFVNDGYYTLNDFNFDPNSQTYTLKDGVVNNRTALGNKDPQPGDMKFKKLSSDTSMIITDKDKAVIGNTLPKFSGGWNNQFSYKGIDLSVFVYFSVGNQVYNANRVEYTTQYLYTDNNMLSLMNDRWKWYDDKGVKVTDPTALAELNKDTKYWTPAAGQYTPQSFAVEDASFLRISNVTLGYTLPAKWLKATRIVSKFRLYFTINNLYTFTKYSGFDPEANTRRTTPLTPGVDYSAYPRSRFMLGGLNITF